MPFVLTIIAGLSTLIGTIPMFIKHKNKDNIINISESFAAGVMITVSIIDLIPEGISLLNGFKDIIIFLLSINIGIVLSIIINKFIPNTDNLYRVGVMSLIAIIMHNIPEGIATYLAGSLDINLGITLCIALALHNIPEGICISIPLYYSLKSKKKAFIYTLISSISEILGAILACMFIKNINNQINYIILGIISGIMLYLPIYEMIPEALKYRNIRKTFIAFISGVGVMIISILILK